MRKTMTKQTRAPKTIPAFRTEDEEMEFWSTHDPDDYFEAEPLEDVIVAIRPRPKQAVTLRMDAELLAQLKEVAAQHGIGYQTLARELLRHALSGGTARPTTVVAETKSPSYAIPKNPRGKRQRSGNP